MVLNVGSEELGNLGSCHLSSLGLVEESAESSRDEGRLGEARRGTRRLSISRLRPALVLASSLFEEALDVLLEKPYITGERSLELAELLLPRLDELALLVFLVELGHDCLSPRVRHRPRGQPVQEPRLTIITKVRCQDIVLSHDEHDAL